MGPYKTTHIAALPRQLRGSMDDAAVDDDAATHLLRGRNSTRLLRSRSGDVLVLSLVIVNISLSFYGPLSYQH